MIKNTLAVVAIIGLTFGPAAVLAKMCGLDVRPFADVIVWALVIGTVAGGVLMLGYRNA